MDVDRIYRAQRDDAFADQFEEFNYWTFLAMPFSNRGGYPAKETLIQLVIDEARKSDDTGDEEVAYVNRLYKIKTHDWEFVHEKVVAFCRERAVLEAFSQGIDHYKEGTQPDGGYVKLFQDAINTGVELEEGARPLADIVEAQVVPEDTLLGERWLCRGGGALFVGPSGVGKSSALISMCVNWAAGREAFGIKPTRPLRIVLVQAENDDGDLAEMAAGPIAALEKDAQKLVRENLLVRTECGKTGEELIASIGMLLVKHRPDLVGIDPLMAYIGGDVLKAEVTAKFLRNGLNPLLKRHGCGALIAHHTPKVTNRDTSSWKVSDWMYAGGGAADVTNWARAILVIDATHDRHTFRLIAAKRGGRLGWTNSENGERELIRHYCHAEEGRKIGWREAGPEDLARAEAAKRAAKAASRGAAKATVEEVLTFVPAEGSITKNGLIEKANLAGIGKGRTRELIGEMLRVESAYEHLVPRSGTNPQRMISREKAPG
jgi:hypothetical protein